MKVQLEFTTIVSLALQVSMLLISVKVRARIKAINITDVNYNRTLRCSFLLRNFKCKLLVTYHLVWNG